MFREEGGIWGYLEGVGFSRDSSEVVVREGAGVWMVGEGRREGVGGVFEIMRKERKGEGRRMCTIGVAADHWCEERLCRDRSRHSLF